MPARDFYAILGVARAATADDIRAAYRRLVRTLHPDVNKAADAQARFTEVQEAYDVLSDPEKRRLYDRVGHAAYASGAAGTGQPGRTNTGTYSWSNVAGSHADPDFDMGDIGSMFDAFFAGRGAPSAGAPKPRPGKARPLRGGDAHASIDVDFLTAARGGRVAVRVRRGDTGRTLDVNVPPGTRDQAKLRVRGEGDPAPTASGQAGDLILTLRVSPHPYLRYATPESEGDAGHLDLHLDVPLSIAEATLGCTLEVPTPDGPVDLRIPPGASTGKRLRLTGRGGGGQGSEAASGRRGDLYAVVRVVVPAADKLSPAQQQALREIAEATPVSRPWDRGGG